MLIFVRRAILAPPTTQRARGPGMDIGSGGSRPRAQRPPGSPLGSLPETRPAAPPDNAVHSGLGPFHPFFSTAAGPCPYVPGPAARQLIVELTGRGAPAGQY